MKTKTKQQLLKEIEQLKEALAWYVEEDDLIEYVEGNWYRVEGKHRAMKLLGMEIE